MPIVRLSKAASARIEIVENFPAGYRIKAVSVLSAWTTGPQPAIIAYMDRQNPTMNNQQYVLLYLKRGYSWYPHFIPRPLTWKGDILVGKPGGAVLVSVDGLGDAHMVHVAIAYE